MLTVQDLLRALTQRLKSSPLYLNQENLCRVQVDDLELNMEWVEDENAVYLYLPLGMIPEKQSNEILQNLMEANLFFQGTTHQALFGLDRALGQVFLLQRFSLANLQDTYFVSACVAMIELAKVWQPKLSANTNMERLKTTRLSSFSEIR